MKIALPTLIAAVAVAGVASTAPAINPKDDPRPKSQ
jgi:hypothetical protein